MEKLLNEIKKYRKEQAELHEWTKKNGHPMTANYTEGGLDTCDKIIAIIERAVDDSSHESSGLNIPPVSNNEALESREGVAVCDCTEDYVCGICFKDKGWVIKDGRFQKQTDC